MEQQCKQSIAVQLIFEQMVWFSSWYEVWSILDDRSGHVANLFCHDSTNCNARGRYSIISHSFLRFEKAVQKIQRLKMTFRSSQYTQNSSFQVVLQHKELFRWLSFCMWPPFSLPFSTLSITLKWTTAWAVMWEPCTASKALHIFQGSSPYVCVCVRTTISTTTTKHIKGRYRTHFFSFCSCNCGWLRKTCKCTRVKDELTVWRLMVQFQTYHSFIVKAQVQFQRCRSKRSNSPNAYSCTP